MLRLGTRMVAACFAIALALAWSRQAHAQEAPPAPIPVNADLWRQSADARLLTTDDASAPQKGGLYARLGSSWSYRPYVWEWEDGEQVDVITNALSAQLAVGWGLGRARVGLTAPVYLYSNGALQPIGGAAVGDASVDVRWSVVESDGQVPGFGLVGRVLAPMGGSQKLLGYAGLSWEAGAIVDWRLDRWLFAANLGTRGIPRIEAQDIVLDDQLWYKAGAAFAVTERVDLSAEVLGSASYTTVFRAPIGNPAEALVGLGAALSPNVRVQVAAGRGLNAGIGAPAFRGVLALTYQKVADRDTDLDGLVDRLDACPEDPEDLDQFEDEDGCPELDNDLDGLVDLRDGCPNNPEDKDGVQDDDGCPESNARVTVELVDREGRPIPETSSSLAPRVGAPIEQRSPRYTVDLTTGTWLLQAQAPGYRPVVRPFDVPESGELVIQQVLEPLMVTGTLVLRVTDPKGTPLTASWRLDNRPEDYGATGGFARRDLEVGIHGILVSAEGYASVELPLEIRANEETLVEVSLRASQVELSRERIDIRDTVYFEFNSAVIKPESYALLDEVAVVIRTHPELALVRIEGHTDDVGSDAYNLKLSQARADSVRAYLVGRGVAPTRLVAYGYGESAPLTTNATEEGRATNRRVAFYIERRSD